MRDAALGKKKGGGGRPNGIPSAEALRTAEVVPIPAALREPRTMAWITGLLGAGVVTFVVVLWLKDRA